MRIALVVPGGLDAAGARSIPALEGLVRRLARRHAVVAYSLTPTGSSPRTALGDATVVDLGLRTRAPRGSVRLAPAATRELLRRVRADGPFDVVHGFWAGTPGLAAAVVARLLGVPAVLSAGGGELVRLPDLPYGQDLRFTTAAQTRLALRLASRVTAASGPMVDRLRAEGVDAVPLPLGAERPAIASPEGASPRRPGPWRLLHVASRARVKDPWTLLEAFSAILRDEPAATLDFLGEDDLGGAVEARAAASGLASRVTFHGRVEPAVRDRFYADSDLLLLTSRHEAGPLVVLEAAAHGLPTVGTAVGHVVDLAPDGAVAVPVGDATGLARATVALLRDPARRHAIAGRARAFAFANDAESTARRFEALYRSVVSESNALPRFFPSRHPETSRSRT